MTEPVQTNGLAAPTGNARLAVLVCGQCGSPAVIEDAPTVRCQACGSAVAIPESHRAALRAERELAATRTFAAGLLPFVKPPGPILRLLGRTEPISLFTVGSPIWLILGFLLEEAAFRAMATVAHVQLWDLWSEGLQIAAAFGFVVGSAGLFTLGCALGRRRALAMAALQHALASAPPRTPGGPAECRQCGGALGPASHGVARCLYCRADNLVVVDRAWLSTVRQQKAAGLRELSDARAQIAAYKRSVRTMLVVFGLIVASLGGIAWVATRPSPFDGLEPTWPPRFAELHDRGTASASGWDHGRPGTVNVSVFDDPRCASVRATMPRRVFLDEDCAAGAGCERDEVVALRRGERLVVQPGAIEPRVTARVRRHARSGGWFYGASDFGPVVAEAPLAADRAFEVTAEATGFYRLELTADHAPARAVLCITHR